MRRRSSVWNARSPFSRRIRPSWKRPRPGLPPIGTVVAGAAEGLSINASAPVQNQADPRKDLYSDRDVPSVSNQSAKLLRVAHAMRGSRSFTAISAYPNPSDSRREWGRLWIPPDRSAIASRRLLPEPKASAARDARIEHPRPAGSPQSCHHSLGQAGPWHSRPIVGIGRDLFANQGGIPVSGSDPGCLHTPGSRLANV